MRRPLFNSSRYNGSASIRFPRALRHDAILLMDVNVSGWSSPRMRRRLFKAFRSNGLASSSCLARIELSPYCWWTTSRMLSAIWSRSITRPAASIGEGVSRRNACACDATSFQNRSRTHRTFHLLRHAVRSPHPEVDKEWLLCPEFSSFRLVHIHFH